MKNSTAKTGRNTAISQMYSSQKLSDALMIRPLKGYSKSSHVLPLIYVRDYKRASEDIARNNFNFKKKFSSKKNSQQIIYPYSNINTAKLSPLLQSPTNIYSRSSINNNKSTTHSVKSPQNQQHSSVLEISVKKFNSPSKTTQEERKKIENIVKINIEQDEEGDISGDSIEVDNGEYRTVQSIASVDLKKFNSPLTRKQSSKKSTVGSLISEQSIKVWQGSRFSIIKRETTIENILEEMNATSNVIIYNDLMIKFIAKDPLLEGINGNDNK